VLLALQHSSTPLLHRSGSLIFHRDQDVRGYMPAASSLDLLRASSYSIAMQNNSLAKLTLQQLKQAVTIRAEIEDLEKELDRIVGEKPSTAQASAPRKKRRLSAAARAKISARMKARWAERKGKRHVSRPTAAKANRRSPAAPLKARIVQTLQAAGKSGATVKDLAAKLGKSYGNISVWFHTTAKGVKEIKKIAPGRFAWVS